MEKKLKAPIRIALLILLAVLIGFSIYSINAARLSGNRFPMPLGFGASVVLSGSMEPELSVGDLLIVVPTDELSVGDVVVYTSSGVAIVHRIIELDTEGGTAVTRGDANNASDDPIPLTAVRGKVVCAIPLLGYVVEAIKTPIATIVLIALAIWLLEASFRQDRARENGEREALMREIERIKSGNDNNDTHVD